MSRPLHGLYAITDSTLLAGGRLLPWVQAALEGGARIIQYRDKSTDSVRRLAEAEALSRLCQQYAATLIINDDPELACLVGAGVHLGQTDGPLAAARALLGPQAVIGATCHASLARAGQAMAEGASYLAFGRFFPSRTKPDAPAAPLELLHQARNRYPLPLVAIGGITLDNAARLLEQGADLLAVVHEVFGTSSAAETERRARAFARLFPEPPDQL